MVKTVSRIPLLAPAPGTARTLVAHRYGEAGARPKAYLQAALHADEIPGMLVLHHLVRLLDAADTRGAVLGEVVIVPAANPIGLAQKLYGSHVGRNELGGGGNFNRDWPDLAVLVAPLVEGDLERDPGANLALVRAAVMRAVEGLEAGTELDSLRHAILRLAADADIVLDLHCDNDALTHMFLTPAHWPGGADLSALMGSRVTLLADISGGNPFDEVFSGLWRGLHERFGPDRAIPPACLSGTIELRGRADVDDALATADAGALFAFLQRRGLVEGDPGPVPGPLCEATPLDAVDIVRAPRAGIVAYKSALGETVAKGAVIAELVDPTAEDPLAARTPLTTRTDGLVFSTRINKFVWPGQTVAKVAGREPLPERKGLLLED